MDQFIHLPEYRVIICKKCQYAILPSEINTHFTKTPVHSLSHQSRQQIIQQVARISNLIQNEKQLEQEGFSFPSSISPAISALAEPKTDGLRCIFTHENRMPCGYVNRHEQLMREHCRDIHGWVNPQKRGRPRRENRVREVPWEENVHCQRFFDHRLYSGYFAVVSQPIKVSTETPKYRIQKMIQNRIDEAKKKERQKIEITDKMQQPNSWLQKVRWEHHLKDKGTPEKLRSLIRPVDEEEEVLATIHASFQRIIEACRIHATQEVVGEEALCKVNAVEYGKKAEEPFYMDMKDSTNIGYQAVWLQVLSFIVRAETTWEAKDRPEYRLNRKQKKSLEKLLRQADGFKDVKVYESMKEDDTKQMQELDQECLQFCIELLDHRITANAYDNAIISGLSILGIKDGGGWLEATEYTTNYSAIIKFARALVIEHGHKTWQRQVKAVQMMTNCNEQEAIESCDSHYELVRTMVDRFMGLEGGRREPTPMDWIISKRSYGMKIQFTTPAKGTVTWIGDTIIYRNVEFSMVQLKVMVQSVVANTRMELMRDLMMIPLNDVGDVNEGQIPVINWATLRDNMAECQVGWSFLNDVRNQFSVEGSWWLFNKIFNNPRLKKRFIRSEEPIQWQQEAIEEFEQHLINVQEGLLFCCHFTGGPPSRAPEILSVRHCNTANGGLRNIGVENGLMFYCPRTHKNILQRGGKEKIVHHYLPREVGELLMYYLWLVLPFWERVQISVDEGAKSSPFVWGVPSVPEKPKFEDKEDYELAIEASPPDPERVECIDVYTKAGPWNNQWTSERLSRIIRREAMKAMDTKLSISSWRNSVQAITERFLVHPFELEKEEEWGDDKREWWAEMFGHSAAMGEDMYGRLMTEAAGQRGSDRAKNRFISQDWHRFLKFPSAVRSCTKAPISFYDEASRASKIQRQIHMRDINIQHELKVYMDEKAEFRGDQERAIQSVMKGDSPILVIMGTGAGKSLIFMLPAFCSQGGTSIVIVPLMSLQGDLKQRCDDSGITSSIWRSDQATEPAAIVFVTPESALTKGFKDFISLLRATHRLDRIVIDECHSILASRSNFRPKMRQLGELVHANVQMVFLTATLRPREEEKFCRLMNIVGKRVNKIRGCTSRANIRYRVHMYEIQGGSKARHEGFIGAIIEVVQSLKIKYPAPAKIIVYSRNKKQCEELAEALQCLVYHADVDDRAGKSKRLQEWRRGQEDTRVIIATNALGLGIDQGDTRAVIHTEMPEDLSDYAQESGRAGRDGEASESIVMMPVESTRNGSSKRGGRVNSQICGQQQAHEVIRYKHKSEQPVSQEDKEMTEEVWQFTDAKCRRVVLDEVMDGRMNRSQCEEGEEMCDKCEKSRNTHYTRQRRERILAILDDIHGMEVDTEQIGTGRSESQDINSQEQIETGRLESQDINSQEQIGTGRSESQDINSQEQIGTGRSESQDINSQEQIEFDRKQSQQSWVNFHVHEANRKEAIDVQEFERQLQRFKNRCPWCFVNGQVENTQHIFKDCSIYGAGKVQQYCREFIDAVENKKTMEMFSCCFKHDCYIPQAICQHWKPKGKNGKWEKDATKDCQYRGVITPAFWSLLLYGHKETMEWLREWSKADGYDIDDDKECLQWLGKKVEWGGIEGNRLHQAFLEMARKMNNIPNEYKV